VSLCVESRTEMSALYVGTAHQL